MVQFRDIVQKQQQRFGLKQDRLPFKRAVLVDQYGQQTSTSPLDDVWAVESERRVWYMTDGAVQPAQCLCRKVSDPYVGLGVIIGYADGSNQLEVLTDDFFLTQTGDPTGWASSGPRDLEPGGLKMMWVYTKVITPLATIPGTGLAVTILAGDYPYQGDRKTFTGYIDFPLIQDPTPGEHYYAGLYLDSANTLQVVYGSSVSTASTAPDPTFPSSVFQLSQVLIDDTQTSINLDTDIVDRRLAWANDNTGGGAWPLPDKIRIGVTPYATLEDACTDAVSGDVIRVGPGTFLVEATIPDGVGLIGSGPGVTLFGNSNAGISNTITFAGGGFLHDCSVYNNADVGLETNGSVTLRNVRNTAGGTNFTSTTSIYNSYIDLVGVAGGADVTVYEGEIVDGVIFSGTLALYGPHVTGTITGALVDGSYYTDNGGRVKASYFRHFQLMGS